MKAVFEIGGKQLIYGEGDVFLTEKLPAETGEKITIDRVLSIIDGDSTKIGNPTIEGAKIELKILNQDKGKKVTVQKYRAKENYRIKRGHRQEQTQVKLLKIHAGK